MRPDRHESAAKGGIGCQRAAAAHIYARHTARTVEWRLDWLNRIR